MRTLQWRGGMGQKYCVSMLLCVSAACAQDPVVCVLHVQSLATLLTGHQLPYLSVGEGLGEAALGGGRHSSVAPSPGAGGSPSWLPVGALPPVRPTPAALGPAVSTSASNPGVLGAAMVVGARRCRVRARSRAYGPAAIRLSFGALSGASGSLMAILPCDVWGCRASTCEPP